MMMSSRKKSARRAVEKTRDGKVKKPTFPPRLEIPQTPRDSHFPHSPGGYVRLTKIEHSLFYEKGDISNVVSMGTFLMSVDIGRPSSGMLKLNDNVPFRTI